MIASRLNRLEEKREKKLLYFALGGIAFIILFVAIFGLKTLVQFSVLVDRARGGTPVEKTSTVILPPALDELPVATYSGTLALTGKAEPKLSLTLFINDFEAKNITVPDSGLFSIENVTVKEGTNTFRAQLKDTKGNKSELSNEVVTLIKKTAPILELSSPEDNKTITGEPNTVTVTGKTEDNARITVNGRWVTMGTNNSFTYAYSLSEGDTTLEIVATDQAGNQKTVKRKVSYHK
ncbi:hypothetical protein HY947_00225 [Candidatus Gottesmanbacteria bacterium]|nr:hypothetical protein [Candidatus Gottesmanbacteria bacterium]